MLVKVYLKSGQILEVTVENFELTCDYFGNLTKAEWANSEIGKQLYYVDPGQIAAVTTETLEKCES